MKYLITLILVLIAVSCQAYCTPNCSEPCDINDVRFISPDDGTVTDTATNLIWLQDANCFGTQHWGFAVTYSTDLNSGECGLSDGSVEGDWRLPSKAELQGIGTDPPTTWYSGNPSVSWAMPGFPFFNVKHSFYWSSTPDPNDTQKAWFVALSNGNSLDHYTSYPYYVLPVRDND